MSHWLVELCNGLTIWTAYIDAVFVIILLLPFYGLYVLYNTIKRGLVRKFIH